MKATVTVRGTGVVPAQPDEVKMVLEVSAQRAKPEEALSEVAHRSEALSGVLDELGIPTDRRTTSGSAVSDVWEYDRQGNRSHAGYRAVNRLIVRLDQPSAIGKLMNQATSKASARIFVPGGTLRRTTPPERSPASRRPPWLAAKPRRTRQLWASGWAGSCG
jgi:uncharacterized protein YggE